MNGRLAALLALALAGTALTGCLQAPDFLQASSSEVSAQANLAAATEAAAAWDPAAKLAGAGTVETDLAPSEADMDGDGSSKDEIPQDPDIGNGLARVWWYAFSVQGDGERAGEVRVWRVLADGSVERQDDQGFGAELGDAGLPIGEWQTDSDSAVDMAKTNGTFLGAIAGENATVVHMLLNEEGKPAWHVVGFSRAGVAVALVDARSGELLGVHTIDLGGFTMPDTEGFAPFASAELEPYVDLTQEGTLSPGDRVEVPFEIPDDAVGMIHLAADARSPMEGVRYVILDEEGEIVARGGTHGGFWGEQETADELELEGGAYTLAIMSSGMMPVGPVELSGAEYAVRLFLGPPGLEMHEDEEEEG